MITDLFTALYNKFNTGNTFDLAVSNQFFPHKAPQLVTYPFAVYQLVTDRPIYTYVTEMEEAMIQIDIFDNSDSDITVLDAQEKLWALLDDTPLTISGYTHMRTERLAHRLSREEDPDVWRSSTDYLITAYKN